MPLRVVPLLLRVQHHVAVGVLLRAAEELEAPVLLDLLQPLVACHALLLRPSPRAPWPPHDVLAAPQLRVPLPDYQGTVAAALAQLPLLRAREPDARQADVACVPRPAHRQPLLLSSERQAVLPPLHRPHRAEQAQHLAVPLLGPHVARLLRLLHPPAQETVLTARQRPDAVDRLRLPVAEVRPQLEAASLEELLRERPPPLQH